MCDPTTIGIAVGSKMADTYMQNQAAKKVTSARNRALEADAAAQRGYQKEAADVNETTQQGFTAENQEAQRSASEEKLKGILDGNSGSAGRIADYNQTSAQAPSVVQSEIARKVGQAVSAGQSGTSSLARLQSYGDSQFKNNLNLTDASRKLETINTNSRGSSAILPYRLDAANRAGTSLSQMGSLFGSLGDLAVAYRLTNPMKKASIFSGAPTQDAGSSVLSSALA